MPQVCSTRVARKVTYDDRAAPHSPFFWCEECFMLMHYDQQVSAGGAVLWGAELGHARGGDGGGGAVGGGWGRH